MGDVIQLFDKLATIEVVALAGRRWITSGNPLPKNAGELEYVLDLLFTEHTSQWSRWVDILGADVADAVFYSGAALEAMYGEGDSYE